MPFKPFIPNPATPPQTRDPFSLYALRDWLREQDRAREYDWHDAQHCLICQHLNAHLGPEGWHQYPRFPTDIDIIVARPRPWTVAAALARCEAEIARREGAK